MKLSVDVKYGHYEIFFRSNLVEMFGIKIVL